MQKIGVYGLWHLGTVLTAVWSRLGNQVVGFDYLESNIINLKNGIPPIYEPNLEECIKQSLLNKTLKYTNNINDLIDCDFIFLAYDTPVNDDDSSDTSILFQSIKHLRTVLKNNAILIISSQSPVGLCRELRSLLKEENQTLEIVYSPENLRLGEALQCYLEPGRIILGTANQDTEKRCIDLFSQIKAEVVPMSIESAEMVKHGINSFLANSIVFANHLSDICEMKNANIKDVIKGMKSDDRIGKKAYLAPGIGFSGGTLGRDLKVLEKINKTEDGFAKLFGVIHHFNNERKIAIVAKIEKILGNIKDKEIGILGLTYKPGTSTLRRSLPIEIIDLLIEKGGVITAFDPKADYNELNNLTKFSIVYSAIEVAKETELIVILTEWPDFININWYNISKLMKTKIIFDTKSYLPESEIAKYGLTYYTLGR